MGYAIGEYYTILVKSVIKIVVIKVAHPLVTVILPGIVLTIPLTHMLSMMVKVMFIAKADYSDGLNVVMVVVMMMLVVPHQLALREHQRGLGINLLRA